MPEIRRARILAAPAAVLLALGLAAGLGACGSAGGVKSSTAGTQTRASTADAGQSTAAGKAAAKGMRGSARVDLSTRPSSIRGARVTSSGAVQTLAPSAKDHRTAQHNSYASIRAFGSEAKGSEATDISFALLQYLSAKAEGDWATACARLYRPLAENLAKLASRQGSQARGCPEAFAQLSARVSQKALAQEAQIDVSSVRRGSDNRAFVIYKTPQTLSADMPMYLEGEAWRVGAIEAYALRPGETG